MAESDTAHIRSVQRPKFTVVIPTYRRARLLEDALVSVLQQRRPVDQVVVISDGPDADARSVAARSGVEFLEVPHGGVARARNAGIAASTGDWVCFLDDDDMYHPEYLAVIESYILAHPEAEAINTAYWRFSGVSGEGVDLVAADLTGLIEASRVVHPVSDMDYLRIKGRSYDLLLEGLRGNLSSSAVRRTTLVKAGCFPEGAICAEDWTMFVNVSRYTEWHFVEHRLVFMRTHEGNNTRTRAVLNGIHTIEAFRDAWQQESRPVPAHRPLDAYRWDYRFMLRAALDSALAERDWRAYRRILKAGRGLLPRTSDRLRAMIPNRVLRR